MITDARGLTIRVDRFDQVQLVDTTFAFRFSQAAPQGTDGAYVVTSAIATVEVAS